jgi:5-methyltetrahydrofolate--homocysteine methyltransferase
VRRVSLERSRSPLVIGERINLSVRKKTAADFVNGDASSLRGIAIEQVRAGADLLDVNVGADPQLIAGGGLTEEALMKRVLEVLQRSTDAPLVLDSSNPQVLQVGLKEAEGRVLINSVTAEKEKMALLLQLAKRYGAAIIILPLSDKGIPRTAVKRLKLAEEVRASALRVGIEPQDILIDPLVMAASAAQHEVGETLESLRLFKERGYQTVIGLSNISFGLPQRDALNATFLAMAMSKGLDAVILNPADERVMHTLAASRVLTALDEGARDFARFCRRETGKAVTAPAPRRDAEKPEDFKSRFLDAVVAGDREGIIGLVGEALGSGISPLEVNLSLLTPALEEVGRLFERKEIFLPQMILAAETVQNAFGRLKREMRGEMMPHKGRIIMATVKGDVHDIGKNICCTVLENYGYEIIDLGRNVPAEVIADCVEERQVDIVGLSALMTTTMKEMEGVIRELQRRSLPQKVIIGGAVVTEAYARKIGAAGYAKDAGAIVPLVKKMMQDKP